MQQLCMKTDHTTFVCNFSACNHVGLMDEGRRHFDCMTQDYCTMPAAEHYACMVDLVGCAGHLNEVEYFIQGVSSEPDTTLWGGFDWCMQDSLCCQAGRTHVSKPF